MLQGDIDALKQEINDLRATVGSLAMEIEELKKVKVEAVSGVFFLSAHACRSRPRFCFRSPGTLSIFLTSSLFS